MINDLQLTVRFQAKEATVQVTQYSAVTCFFLEKSRSQKPQTVMARLHRI